MTDSRTRGRVRVEPGLKRVRAYLGAELVVDTTTPLLVWENPYYPAYYLPAADVRAALVPTATTSHSPSRGDAIHYTVKAGGKEAVDGAWSYPDSPIEALRDHVRFEWDALDTWFEEDEEVYVHPRDPYKRVDILASSRHVRVEVDGVAVAETTRPRILFETSLPPRYYIPKTDVRLDLLEPTGHVTQCPYKGTASYYTLVIDGHRYDNLAWWYQHPTLESSKIAGHVAFYNEFVDLYVDERRIPRPTTPFS
jgi:uncharacterized protein (DUF427 family)